MRKIFKKYQNIIKEVIRKRLNFKAIIIICLFIIFSLSYTLAWTSPSIAPPGGNTDQPLNVGSITQYKSGALGIVNYFKTKTYTYLATLAGNVGIGTTTPPEKLTLEGGNFLQTAGQPQYINTYDMGSVQIVNVDFSGKYAYGIGNKLFIFDVSNPTQPQLVSQTTANGGAIKVAGKYAYVADDANNFLRIFDISNPKSPQNIINYPTGGDTLIHIFVSGKYAYASFQNSSPEVGFLIFNISDPANPTIIARKVATGVSATGKPQGFYVAGRYAYLISAWDGATNGKLVIFDIADSANPIQKANPYSAYRIYGFYVSGSYAFLSTADSGGGGFKFRVVDVSNPDSPTLKGTTNEGASGSWSIVISGGYAYVVGSDAIKIFNISNVSSPTLKYTVSSAHSFTETRSFVYNKHLYLAQGQYLDVYDISGIDTPTASIGNIAASQINVSENMDIGNNLYVRTGLNVGPGGIKADGVIVASSTDILRYLKAIPASAPADCAAGNKGEVYYDNTLNAPCFCDGANWVRFNDHSVVCSP